MTYAEVCDQIREDLAELGEVGLPERTTHGGRSCWKVPVTNGKERLTYYFTTRTERRNTDGNTNTP